MSDDPSSLPPLPATPPPLPVLHRSLRRRYASLRKALVALGICFALLLGLLTLIGTGVELGVRDLKITMAMAFLPVPIYVAIILWLDRMEKEPAYLLIAAFLYGG